MGAFSGLPISLFIVIYLPLIGSLASRRNNNVRSRGIKLLYTSTLSLGLFRICFFVRFFLLCLFLPTSDNLLLSFSFPIFISLTISVSAARRGFLPIPLHVSKSYLFIFIPDSHLLFFSTFLSFSHSLPPSLTLSLPVPLSMSVNPHDTLSPPPLSLFCHHLMPSPNLSLSFSISLSPTLLSLFPPVSLYLTFSYLSLCVSVSLSLSIYLSLSSSCFPPFPHYNYCAVKL